MATLQTPWCNKTVEALQLNGKGERTQQAYARAVRMLIEFHGKDPDQITEEELKAYFLHRKNVDQWAPNTLRIAYCAIKFFYLHVVRRDWHILNILKAQSERRLPSVLTRDEIDNIFQQINTFHNYVFLTTVYSCGLRLQEALYLETGDIDASRRVIHVHRGKGAKDRYVPLPDNTVRLMRQHWKTHRNSKLIFPYQYHKTRQWPKNQKQRQLPGHHFMITFTMPQEIRDFIRSHQRVCYSAMFKVSSDSIKKLAKDPKFIGGDLVGFFGVLHTWGRQLQYHPHIHYIAPGGAVSDGKWLASRIDFFLPVHALSKIFRAKFKHEMDKAGLLDEIPESVWEKSWNVNSQAVPTQEHCIIVDPENETVC